MDASGKTPAEQSSFKSSQRFPSCPENGICGQLILKGLCRFYEGTFKTFSRPSKENLWNKLNGT